VTKQQKKLASEKVDFSAIEAFLNRTHERLWEGGILEVPCLEFSDTLQRALQVARASGQLVGGLEAIETLLQREQAGLVKMGVISANKGVDVISRLLLVGNDGSERFYRSVESLQKRVGPRLLVCRVDAEASELGKFFGSRANVKALLVARKEFVLRLLTALIETR
jgi:antitoxin component HigA of HigAB toxin-antitoxin module